MIKTYTIISTYPENGSKNIGDALITSSTIEAIKDVKNAEKIRFNVVWRAEEWDNIKEKILNSDAIIFACLAIRKNMTVKEYPSINRIIDTGIPMAVISAGTDLDTRVDNFFNKYPKDTINTLKELDKKSLFFGTRGVLSQEYCNNIGLKRVHFTGDIAFYDKRYNNSKFKTDHYIKKIAISDPHYSKVFISSLDRLVKELEIVFPLVQIDILLHGKNKLVEEFCSVKGINTIKIYLDVENGLDIYNDYDLHVGYRVHAHVSMLKRRKPSYLLEQDGRGLDYGLTIQNKISINSIPKEIKLNNFKNLLKIIFGKELNYHLSETPVELLMSIIKKDYEESFIKFKGLEVQINKFINNILFDFKKLP